MGCSRWEASTCLTCEMTKQGNKNCCPCSMLMSYRGPYARVQQFGSLYSIMSIVYLIHSENSIDRVG